MRPCFFVSEVIFPIGQNSYQAFFPTNVNYIHINIFLTTGTFS